ncbi:MAG: Zn-ribbon domain-containing OB-fold protein [Chloroflexi bacterium]|nr:Zn-ribbon domain-containing OB-fold protein [Chloroflexota bacterium]
MTEQPFFHTMDIFPQETAEQNKLYRFFELLREGRLTSTRCNRCDIVLWPPRTVCPSCFSDELEWVDLPKRAKLFAHTVQWAGVPTGFEIPLLMGMVEFESGLKILSRIVDAKPEDLEIGREVEFTVREIPGNRVVHAFRPVAPR